jgi:integrase
MHLSLGLLQVTIKYTYPRGRTTIYQRAIPTDLRDRYPGANLKQDLKTADPIKVARMASALNAKLEAEWNGLRASPESSPKALKVHATAFLKARGVVPGTPDNHPMAIELLHDHMDNKRMQYAGGDEEEYRDAAPEDYLSPVEIEAGRLLHGETRDSLTDALELHLGFHPQRDNERFVTYQRRAFDGLIAVTGDKAIDDFGRSDARAYLEASLGSVKTATVRRRLGVLSAVFATYIREKDLPRPNPFASLQIPKEGHDKCHREPFTTTELATMASACRAKDDPMRWILLMLAGTGARLAEIAGLLLDDIVLDAPFPHVILQVHPWRDIKGAKGLRGVKDRTVPLIGSALWAAQRLKAEAAPDQIFAFPQYTNSTICKATHASNALNSWLRRQKLAHTCHDLRHTVKDQLRAVQCPKDISDAITGHGKKDTGDGYGYGYGHGSRLQVTSEWLAKAATEQRVHADLKSDGDALAGNSGE